MTAPQQAPRRWVGRDLRVAVAVLVGLVAVAGAVFGWLEIDAGKQQERASFESARLATQVFEATAATSQVDSFALNAAQDTVVGKLALTARTLAAMQAGQDSSVLQAEAPIEDTAAQRLGDVITGMTDRTKLGSVADAHTAHVLSLTDSGLVDLVTAQSHAVDLANQFGSRSTDLVYALSLAALAGVLAGLAGVLRRGVGGLLSLVAGFAALLLAAGIGVVAMLG